MQNETQKFVDMMSHEDIEKLKAVTLYILSKCGATDYIHLFKILYFAEKKHYATYGAHITNDTFIAMEHGPVPSFLYDALKLVTHQETASPNNALWEIAKAVHPGSVSYSDRQVLKDGISGYISRRQPFNAGAPVQCGT